MERERIMSIKIKKQIVFKIFIIAVLNVVFSGYLLTDLNSSKNDNIIQSIFGSISVECSSNIILVMVKAIPMIVFFSWIVNKYISELKDNFIYIFLRTSNRENCLQKTVIKTFLSIFIYEFFVITTGLIIFIAPRGNREISVDNVCILLVVNTLQMFMIALISNMLVLFKSEVVANLGNIILTTTPLIVVGVLYEERLSFTNFAKWFPLNLGNYTFLNSMKENVTSILAMLIISCGLYFITVHKLKKYELL